MSLIFSFQNFDPLNGEVPEHFTGAFCDVAKRARKILNQREGLGISRAMEAVEWMVNQGGPLLGIDDLMTGETNYPTYAKRLFKAMPKVDISDYLQFPNAEWHEYFAVLALAIIGDAINVYEWAAYEKGEIPDDIDKLYFESQGNLLAEAMEAVVIAESLIREKNAVSDTEKNTIEHVEQKISLQRQMAGQERHRPTNDAVADLIKFHAEGDFKNPSQATKAFNKKYPEKIAHLNQDYVFDTMYKRLLKHLNEENKPKPA